MRKNSHFIGQPLYGQVIKVLDKSKILQFSRENGGERYTARLPEKFQILVKKRRIWRKTGRIEPKK